MKTALILTISLMLTTTRFTFAQSGRSVTKPKPSLEQRSVGSFDQLTVQNAINVFITPGDAGQIELESDADQLQQVVTRVKGSELIVEVPKGKLLYDTFTNSKGETTRNSKPISVTLHVSALKTIHLKTACSLTIDTPIDVDQLTVWLSTACNLTTALSVQTLNLNLDKASQAMLRGSVAGRADLTLREASQLMAGEMTVNQATIELSGSSRANLGVTGTLTATADGVSRLTYSGNPTVKSIKATGLSSINRN